MRHPGPFRLRELLLLLRGGAHVREAWYSCRTFRLETYRLFSACQYPRYCLGRGACDDVGWNSQWGNIEEVSARDP